MKTSSKSKTRDPRQAHVDEARKAGMNARRMHSRIRLPSDWPDVQILMQLCDPTDMRGTRIGLGPVGSETP